MIQPHELFPGAYLLDKDGQPFSVESFVYMPDYVGGAYALNGLHLLSECSPIELTKKIVDWFDVINGVSENLIAIRKNGDGYELLDMLNNEDVVFETKYLHDLQRFFIQHYTPITINEQQLREAIK
jgi:hypothetical protein